MSHAIFLALGSNLYDRLANLKAARQALAPAVRLLACSPVYETPPWGYLDQPAFLNQVLKAETDLAPSELLAYLKHLEIELGRRATFRNGPRRIDLDILFYDDIVVETSDLSIPHPRLPGRAFVLVPLADLAPDLIHPILGRTVRVLMESTDLRDIHLYIAEECEHVQDANGK